MSERRVATSGDVSRGMAWIGAASSLIGILDVVAHVLLLYILGKEEYGVGIVIMAIFPALDKATDLGLTAAIIQRDDHTPEKISTLFWLNVLLSSILTIALVFGVGPLVQEIQGKPIRWIISAYGIKITMQNIYYIPHALMKRDFRFKELSVIRFLANVGEFGGKIVSAILGAGPWAFVIGPLVNAIVVAIGVQSCHPWRPRFVMKFREAWDWTVYGFRTSASQILFHVYTNLDYHICGAYFGHEATGLYGLAYLIVLTPSRIISEVTTTVAFSDISSVKHSRPALLEKFLFYTRTNLVTVLAFLGAVFVVAPEIIGIFSDYDPADSEVLWVLAAVGVLRAMSFVMPPLLDGMNKAQLTLRYMMVAAVAVPASLWLSAIWLAEYDELSIAIGWALGYPIAFAVLVWMVLHAVELKWSQYLRSVAGIIACSLFSVLLGSGVRYLMLDLHPVLRFVVCIVLTVSTFLILLGKTQGITLRSVAKSLKQKDEPVEPADIAPIVKP